MRSDEIMLMTVGDWLSGRIHLPLTFWKGEYIGDTYIPTTYDWITKDMNVDSQDVSIKLELFSV